MKTICIYPFNNRLHTIYDSTLEFFIKNYPLRYNYQKRDLFYKLKNNLFLVRVYRFLFSLIKKIKNETKIKIEKNLDPKENILFCFNELPPEKFDFILDMESVIGLSNYDYNKLDKKYISRRLASKKCKAIICWNHFSYQSLIKVIGCSKFKNKIKIIPFAGKISEKKCTTNKFTNFLFISSINNPDSFETKGGLIALETYVLLTKKYKNIRFFIRARVNKKIIKKYKKIPGLVFIQKYLSKKKMDELMYNSDILLEPIPGINLLLECMSFGIVPISFDFWSIKDMVVNKKTGFLIDSSNVFGKKDDVKKFLRTSGENYKKLYKMDVCLKFVKEFFKKTETLMKNKELLKKMRIEQSLLIKNNGLYSLNKRNKELAKIIDKHII